MLTILEPKGSDRKLRLFAVACCRSVSALLIDERSRHAVDIAERYAESGAGEDELLAAYALADQCASAFLEAGDETRYCAALAAAWVCVDPGYANAAYAASHAAYYALQAGGGAELSAQAALLADIFPPSALSSSPPPAPVPPEWLLSNDGAARRLCHSIDEGGRYEWMPQLADALEDAGCRDERILEHCRAPGTHVRGCWVLDLLLGKH
jgi:hypothetical protein